MERCCLPGGSDIPDNDLHLFNLTGEKEMLVYPSRYHSQGRPAISGDYIVWEEGGEISGSSHTYPGGLAASLSGDARLCSAGRPPVIRHLSFSMAEGRGGR
ncbi:hypothetical protein [Methanogenium cariaci]|uniref:hypothetical protein n=1 Tax=Methanogenium cariaci TaxID=2197 RepID=UPI0007810C5D|nr:hypothetical protein [Methanogenium cariaci]